MRVFERMRHTWRRNPVTVLLLIAAILVTIYGFAETVHRTNQLYEQRNKTGAESVWTHFLFRYGGGWVGALVGIGLARSLRQVKQAAANDAAMAERRAASEPPRRQGD